MSPPLWHINLKRASLLLQTSLPLVLKLAQKIRNIFRGVTESFDWHLFTGHWWSSPKRVYLNRKFEKRMITFSSNLVMKNPVKHDVALTKHFTQPLSWLLYTSVRICLDGYSSCTFEEPWTQHWSSLYHRIFRIATVRLHSPSSAVIFIDFYLKKVHLKTWGTPVTGKAFRYATAIRRRGGGVHWCILCFYQVS